VGRLLAWEMLPPPFSVSVVAIGFGIAAAPSRMMAVARALIAEVACRMDTTPSMSVGLGDTVTSQGLINIH
jgi:hypothetical protein